MVIERGSNARIEEVGTGDIVLIEGPVERAMKKKDERLEEGKRRVAVILRYEDIVFGIPIYTTGNGKPARPWEGPARIGIIRDGSNRLVNVLSQLGTDNACVLAQKNLLKGIGLLCDEDREIMAAEFWRQVAACQRLRAS